MYQDCQRQCSVPVGGSDESWKRGAYDTLTQSPENTFSKTVSPPTASLFQPSGPLPSLCLPGVEIWQILGIAWSLSLA